MIIIRCEPMTQNKRLTKGANLTRRVMPLYLLTRYNMGKVKESDQARQQASTEQVKPFEVELTILKQAVINDNEVLVQSTNTIKR